jgi:hypothetical protein
MPGSSTAPDFDEPFDIHSDLSAQVAFYLMPFVYGFANTAYFLVGEVLDLGVRVNASSRHDSTAHRRPYAIDILQRKDNLFVLG